MGDYLKQNYLDAERKKENRKKERRRAIITVVLILIGMYGLSYLVTIGLIKLITLCFGLTFKLSIATGIWLVLCFLQSFLSNN